MASVAVNVFYLIRNENMFITVNHQLENLLVKTF